MSVKTEPDGFFKAESVIDARGKCAEIRSREEEMEVSLVINHALMPEGISAQQRKMGIAAIQEMYTKALVFLGHEVNPGFLPGMVVRVNRHTDSVHEPWYIGVIERIDDDRITLRTLDVTGAECIIEVARSQFTFLQDPAYMGIEGLRQLVKEGFRLTKDLSAVFLALNRKDAAAKEVEIPPVAVKNRAVADAAAMMSIEGDEDEFVIPTTPEEKAWDQLVGDAVLEKATVISFERDGGELEVRLHVRDNPHVWTVPEECSVLELYNLVKRKARMNLEVQGTQKGMFHYRFLLRRVRFAVETFFRDGGECLVIVPVC